MFIIYDLIFIVYALFALFYYLLKKKLHKEIFFRFYPNVGADFTGAIWIHAVSVGEAKAVKNLYGLVKKRFPKEKIIISTITPAGNNIAKSFVDGKDAVIYLPLDFSFIVRKFIKKICPKVFVCVETEIWPNLFYRLSKEKVPIIVVNGRVSLASSKGYRVFNFILKPVLEKINLFCAQTEADALRIISLGLRRDKVFMTGNLKFDLELPKKHVYKLDLGLNNEEYLLIAGSTHPGEEAIILEVFADLRKDFHTLKLLLAPRHVNRVKDLEALCTKFNFTACRFSLLSEASRDFQVILLDTIGDLSSVYSAGDVIFVGGSLVEKGGQNIIEPALFSKPIIFGPNMANFAQIKDIFLEEKAALMVKDKLGLEEVLRRLFSDEGERISLGKRANDIITKNAGATSKTLELLSDFIK